MPQARVVALDRLMSGAEIAQRVIVSGVVQRCELYNLRWWMRVETPVGHLFVEAADGVTDSPREQFHISIDKLRAGEHLLVVRAYDTANNAGLAKVVIR